MADKYSLTNSYVRVALIMLVRCVPAGTAAPTPDLQTERRLGVALEGADVQPPRGVAHVDEAVVGRDAEQLARALACCRDTRHAALRALQLAAVVIVLQHAS